MESFSDFIKSSKELLNECLELFLSIERDVSSDNFTEEMKCDKIRKVQKKFKKLNIGAEHAENISIMSKTNFKNLKKRKSKVIDSDIDSQISDGIDINVDEIPVEKLLEEHSGHDTIPIKKCFVVLQPSDILSEEMKDNNINNEAILSCLNKISIDERVISADNNILETSCQGDINNKNSEFLSKDVSSTSSCSVILADVAIPYNIIPDIEIPNKGIVDVDSKTNEKPVEGSINVDMDHDSEVHNIIIKNPSGSESNSVKFDELHPLPDNNYEIKECFVILKDLVSKEMKDVSEKDYFSKLDKEINKLSHIPTFSDKKSHKKNKESEKKIYKKKENGNKSNVFQSDSDNDADDSESNLSEKSEDVDIVENNIDEIIVSNTDSESSSEESNPESENSSVKVTNQPQKEQKRHMMTRSLKMPIMASELSEKPKKKSNTDSDSKSIVCLSSSSEQGSDSSDSPLLENSNKRKRSAIQKNQSKKQKLDTDEENKDNKDEIVTRKNIHKIFTQSKLSLATITAEQRESERRKRMEEKQEMYNKSTESKKLINDEGLSSLILEKDQDGNAMVEVHEQIANKLKVHQIEAINFMYDCVIESVACSLQAQKDPEPGKPSSIGGCVLAHCMGLGKTLSTIAFIHTMLTTPILNLDSCIVVCPVNTALNWKNEFKMWIPANRPLKIFEFSSKETKKDKTYVVEKWQQRGGVLIIGYEMFRMFANGDSKSIRNKKIREKMVSALVDPGADIIVCDEGHLLKNEKSAITKVINKVVTKRRIILTGTPLQNRLLEYHTMVNFVKPSLLGTQREFLNRFVNPINNGQHINSTAYDVQVMKKRSHILFKTLDGCVHRRDYSALVKYLPPKYEYVIKIRMSDIQIKLYNEYLSMVGISRNRLFQDQMSLARIWTHPFVVCMHQEIQDKRILLADTEDESFIDDVIEDEKQNTTSKKPLEENNIISLVSGESENDEPKFSNTDTDVDKDCDDSVDEVVQAWSSSTRTNGRANKRHETTEPDIAMEPKHWWSDIIQPDHENQIEISGKLTILFQILRKASEMGDKVIVFSHSLLVLDIIEKYMFELQAMSDKINQDLKKLNDSISTKDNNAMDHSSFFSQHGYNTWVKGLDYDRMDGSTQLNVRADIQAKFNNQKQKRLRLFLISTKAGGMGINLVSANRVVIFDVSWNPSHDIQAIFRSYRFGQVKPVYVYRLVSQGTMEEKMYERQVTKLSLSLRVVDEQQISRYFTEEDLRSLYKFTPDIYDPEKNSETPILPKDRFLAELIQEFPQWIYGYHEHDSLLQNKDEEELTEAERQDAWKEFEYEKVNGVRPVNISTFNHTHNTNQIPIDPNEFAKVQMSMVMKHYPQYASIYSQNYLNMLNFVLNQQPDLLYNASQLGIRIQSIFLQSLAKFQASRNMPAPTIDVTGDEDTTE